MVSIQDMKIDSSIRSLVFANIKSGYYKKSFAPQSTLKSKYNYNTKTFELKAM